MLEVMTFFLIADWWVDSLQEFRRGGGRDGRPGSRPHGPLVAGVPARDEDRLDLPALSEGLRSGHVAHVGVAYHRLDPARP